MPNPSNQNKFPFSPFNGGAGGGMSTRNKLAHANPQQDVYIEDLQRVNDELRRARRAALNLMEDTILSQEALRQSEEKYRTKLEQDVRDRTAELNATKELLQATLDSSFYVIQAFKAVRNQERKIVDFTWVMNNKHAVAHNGDVIGKSLLQHSPWVIPTGLFERFVQVTETGIPLDYEQCYSHEQINGWYHQTLVKMGDGFVMNTEDISEKKKTEETIRKFEEQFRLFVTTSSDIVYKMNPDWTKMYNLVGKNFLNDTQESTETWVEKYIPAEAQQRVNAVIDKAIRSKGVFEYAHTVIRNSGSIGWIYSRAIPILNEEGEIVEWFGTAQDITEQKEAEQEILRLKDEIAQKATDKYLTLFNSMEEGFVMIELLRDETGRIANYIFREANPAFEKLVGLKPEEVVGKTVLDLYPALDDFWVNTYAEVVDRQQPVRFEHYFRENNQWYEVLAYPMGKDQAAILYNNIAERKKAEEAIRESEEHKEFLLKLNDTLRQLTDPVEIQYEAARLVAEQLEADRVHFAEISEDETLIVHKDYVHGNTPSIAGTIKERAIAVALKLERDEPVVIADVQTFPLLSNEEKAALAAVKIRSQLSVALSKKGKKVASFAVDQTTPREWTPLEVSILQAAAERTLAAVEKAKAEEALRRSEFKFRRLSESGIVAIVFFDINGSINDANEAFLQMLGVGREDLNSSKVHWNTYTPEEWIPRTLEAIEEFNKTGYIIPYEKQYIHSSGELRWGIFSGITLGDGETGVSLILDITGRKKAEEALLESEAELARELEDTQKLQKISSKIIEEGDVDALHEALIDSAIDIMHSDFASIQVLNPASNQLLLVAWRGFHPASAEVWKHIHANSTTSCRHALLNNARIIFPDVENCSEMSKEDLNEYRRSGIVAMQSTPLISRSGKIVGMLSTHWKQVHQPSERELGLMDVLARQAADLIERKQAEDAIRESEDRFRTLANAVPQVIWGNDEEGKANYFNQRWYEYSGFNYEQSVGLGWEAIEHPDDGPASVAKWNEALSAEKIFDTEYRLRRKDGAYRWFIGRNVPLKDASGKVTGWFGSATDIEDLKRAEEAVRNASDRLQLAIDAGNLGTYEYDFSTGECFCSPQHKINFGYPENEPVTFESLKERIVPEDRMYMENSFNKALDKDGVYATEYRTKLPNGDIRWIRSVGRFLYNEKKLPQKMVGITINITEQKLFTEELTRMVAERTKDLERSNADLQQFAHVASHDLKEPVRKIKTFNNRIIDEFSSLLPDKVRTYLSKIGNSTDRMYLMIDGILNYSRFGNAAPSIKTVDLSDIIRQIETDLEVLIEQKNARIETTKLPLVRGDSVLLYQLFYNLILNSLKFSKADQTAIINVYCEKIEQDKKKYYKIILSDNGIGFEQEYAEAIFESFSRLNTQEEYEGTGLGLSLCKKIIERHGGSISATGELNKGASFIILLPVE